MGGGNLTFGKMKNKELRILLMNHCVSAFSVKLTFQSNGQIMLFLCWACVNLPDLICYEDEESKYLIYILIKVDK